MRRLSILISFALVACGDNTTPEPQATCTDVSDCAASTACATSMCVDGQCTTMPVAAGTAIASQTAGDCQSKQCDGSGNVVSVADDNDVPADVACLVESCVAGAPHHEPSPIGTACGTGLECDGGGACVHCTLAAECPGSDSECSARTCFQGVCGIDNAPAGTALKSQTAGDCQKKVCDGSGGTTTATDNTDLPNDHNACTSDICTAGVPSNPDLPSGTSCGSNVLCNGAGACVGCLQPTDCAGTDTDCAVRTCVANTCGVSFTAAGTLTSQQTSGDCEDSVCDGNGNFASAPNNTDLPVDGNDCTADVCTAGVPSNPPLAQNTLCSGGVCDGAGACVAQCQQPSDCPGVDDACSTRTCVNNACGVILQPDGTPLADDGNSCTNDVCLAGVPHPALADGTACTDGTSIDSRCRTGACSATVSMTLENDATSGLTSSVTIEEHFVSDGALVPNGTYTLPIADGGGAHACTQIGSSSDEGYLGRSFNEEYLVLGCYDTTPGTTTGTVPANVVARIDVDRGVDTSTALATAFVGGGAIRSVASTDGIDLWVGGSPGASANGGAWFTAFGATTGEAQIVNNPTTVRTIEIQNAGSTLRLYGASNATGFENVFTIGFGTQSVANGGSTPLPGMPVSAPSNPHGYALFRLASVVNDDTLYVADDRAPVDGGGIQKWTLVGATWTLSTTFTSSTVALGYRGMTAFQVPASTPGCNGSATCVEILAITAADTASELVSFIDPNTGDAVDGLELGVVAPASKAYRGIALTPHAPAADVAFAPRNNGFSVGGVAPKPCFQSMVFGGNSPPNFIAACSEDQGVWLFKPPGTFQTAPLLSTSTPSPLEVWTNQDGATAGQQVTNLRGHAVHAPTDSPASVFLTDPDATTGVNGWRSNSFSSATPTWPASGGGGGQIPYASGGVPIQVFSVHASSSSNNFVGGWHPTLGAVLMHGNIQNPALLPTVSAIAASGVTGTVTSMSLGPSFPTTDVQVAVFGEQGDTLQTGTGSPATGGGIYWSCDISGTSGGTFFEHDTGISAADKALVYSLTPDQSTFSATATRTSCTGVGTVTGFNQIIYASLRGGGQVYKTVDGGATWTQSNTGLPAGIEVRQIAIDSVFRNLLYAATSDGVYKSVDGARTWVAVGLQGSSVRSVTLPINHLPGLPRVFAAVDDTVGMYSAP